MPIDQVEVHVSPAGSPYGDGSARYPVPDLVTARDVVRRRRDPGQPATVWVAPGRYEVRRVLELDPRDSHTRFAALDPERLPVFAGAAVVRGWSETDLDGVRVWAAPAPSPCGRSLYVDGVRRQRPRLPRDGFLRIAEQAGLDLGADMVSTLFDGTDRFRYHDGDIPSLREPTAVEVVVPHYWVQERLPVASIDPAERVVTSSFRSIFSLRDDAVRRFARYYLDNVVEALGEVPGEWYHDRSTRRLLYVPMPGEQLESFSATVPVLSHFAILRGHPERQEWVRSVRFEGLRFAYSDADGLPGSFAPFDHREDPVLPRDVPFGAAPQAAADVAAAFELTGARGCAIVGCTVSHLGGYAVGLGYGCQGVELAGNTFTDLGAGAIKVSGSTHRDDPSFTGGNEIRDNEIATVGRVNAEAVAVLVRHSAGNLIAGNHIHDAFYTGISVGWVWGYDPSVSSDNVVERNHIHDLGHGLLNDLGGIYLLGVAPGTVVRGNHIHDVACANYGGWGIYLDEGSSHVVVEGNVVHDVGSQCFHQHYGRENVVRHNVFAFGAQGAVAITRPEPHVSFTFSHNLVVTEGVPAFAGTSGRDVRTYGVDSDLNLYWDPTRPARLAGNGTADDATADWRALGRDLHSIVADPGYADLEARDFTVGPGSPVHGLGIRTPNVRPTSMEVLR